MGVQMHACTRIHQSDFVRSMFRLSKIQPGSVFANHSELFRRVENIVGKENKAEYQQFLFIPPCIPM